MSIRKKDIIDLLVKAKEKGMTVFLENGKLRYTIDKNKSADTEFISDLKKYKGEITEFLSSEAGDFNLIKAPVEKILPADRSAIKRLPITFSQERLWFIDQLEGSAQYHMPAILRLNGKLNKDALTYALQNIVNRHEVLRTVIREEEGKGYQLIKDADQWMLHTTDGSNYKDNAEGLRDYIKQLINVPFNLKEDYMMRGNLIQVSEEDHILVLTLHHIAADGWSISVIVSELVELYESHEEGREAKLQQLPLQYADYAVWQRNYLQGDILEKKLSYWKKKLKGAEALQLPTDYDRPAVQSIKGAAAGFKIDKDLSEQLQELSKRNEATLFMTLLAAFNILLYRYSGQQDICLGSPIAGRQQQELEGLIGFFVNTLALRSEINSDSTFAEFLQQVRVTTLEAYENQEAPFEKVVEAVVNQRDLSRSPLFQVMFILQNTPEVPELRLGELKLSTGVSESNISRFDLLFSITETSAGLHGIVEYCTDLYNEKTITRMIDHFKQLLRSIAADPQKKTGLLQMLTKNEEHQLLKEFNDTSAEYPEDKSIADLFEEQVLKTPDDTAVVFGEQRLTYRELNERSNKLAHYLKGKGVKEDTLVPVCLDRSPDMIAAIIGILKARAAYVPIDPEYPEERINYMIEDSGAAVMISSKELRAKLKFKKEIEIIETDDEHSAINEQLTNLPGNSKPYGLAYVLYTSGSTGNPKGVKMPGSGLVNLLHWQEKQFVNKKRNVLQFTSLNFDVSFQEIFSTLCFGSTLYLIEADRRADMSEVLKDIAKYGITHLFIPYIVLKNLAEHISAQSGEAYSLEEIITAGEQLKLTGDIEALINKSSIRLINQYGPTEAHVVSSYVIDSSTASSSLPPIGKPIDNIQLYILRDDFQPVPVGVTGEIYIGGVQVARGYLNLPGLTEEKFIKDPFSDKEGSRLYRTGDLGRWLPDGNIEYAGRTDDQIKIRGYRVETGEIESVLQECKSVRQAVVIARETKEGSKRLTGYVVPEGVFDKEEIISNLQSRLPEYMIPAFWVELESIPLTANGKVNKKALPDPDVTEGSIAYEAPRDELEEKLASIWQRRLDIERAGINDNFFELGGHSLLAMRVISLIRRELELELTIKDLFLHPTIAKLAVHLSNQVRGSVLPAIEVHPRPEQIPLSFSQERLWFIDRMEGSAQYHMPAVLRLKGKLNKDALAYALQNIVNRHEVLRTVIKEDEGKGYQIVKDKDCWKLQFVDGKIYEDNAEGLKNYIAWLVTEPFDLSKDHMIRGHLICMNEQDHLLVLTLHHIASDGWSTSIMVREFAELYGSFGESREAKLLSLPVQYADFAIWQRNYLQGEVLEKKIDYWKEKLSETEPLQLPTDFNRPSVQSTKGNSVLFSIDKESSVELKKLSQQQEATLFMTLLSVFNVLLYRYSGQSDICVGSPISGRQQKETEDLIGFFINTLALRSEVNGDDSFSELLQQVKTTTLEAYENQEVPFEKVVDSVVRQRDMSRSPLFQVTFVLQNTPEIPVLHLGDLNLSGEEFPFNISKYDLTFNVTETEEGLQGTVDYCTDLFNVKTVERMIGHFKELIRSVIRNPHQKTGLLPMLGKSEERQLLVEFNETASVYPKEKSIVDLFEEQAARTPDNIALVYKDQELTYKELNERSNQLAYYLNVKGVKAGTLVSVCMERSIEMITGILGILKSGGAYVPLDPLYPDERIKYMLEDTGALTAITGKESKQKLSSAENIEIIETDSDWSEISKHPSENMQRTVKPEDLAYVIYTSGSTGRPKGVMIEHKSVVNLITWHNQCFFVTENSRATAMAGVSFDAFGWEIWPYLSAGASVNIIDDDIRLSASGLSSVFNSKQITHCFMPTALVQEFINESGQKLKSLQYLLTGGDKLPGLVIKGIPFKLVNNYGPTENTVVTTCYELSEKDPYTIPPIGKPISNTVVRILNEFKGIVPVGVTGEICTGGAGLTRGYLNRPELNADKFINDPFDKDTESRLYRTGDSGRWLPDGNIEYLGRMDEQVKIRGYRIEPGEIESVLQESELVRQAVVLAADDKEGNKRLAGYVVPEGAFDRDAIMQYLRSRLPEYMIPALWVELENLPLTKNGKIDRKALPHPDVNELTGNEYEAPRNETERMFAKIWKDLLHIDRVGINDNFFDLGGHSLLAMRVISSVRKEMELEIAIKTLFLYPTLKGLSEHLDSQSKGILLPSIKIQARSEFIPLSFSQERLWFIDRLEGSIQYHVPAVLRLKGKLNKDALAYALRNIVNRHEVLRTVISEKEGKGYQLIKDKDSWELQMVDGSQFRDNVDGLKKYIQGLINAPFDLTADSMIRGDLIGIEDNDHLLVVTIHHIASDGWSISLIVKELAELYKAYDEDREANLLPLPVQYADYSIWQRTYLQGDILDEKLSYWKEKLLGGEPLELPSDFTRPAVQSARGAIEGFSIDKELTEKLNALSKQHGSTLFMTLLSAFKALLYRYSGQQDISVGIPVAGRQQEEVEELIGFFINTLVLRSEVRGDASFTELLQQVRTTTLEAYENQDVPFEKVVENVIKVRDQSRSPLFQVMFVFQNTPDVPELHFGEVVLSVEGHEQTTAKFDLTVNMMETPEGLFGTFQYCTDLYREDTIKRMMAHYIELIRSVIKAPDNSIDSLPILTRSEENQLLVEFNPPSVNYPNDKTIIDLFEEQVTKTPGAVAVVFEQEKLTYKELNERSNQLAHYLQSNGVKPETLVPICIERSTDMITGMLGILKAGGVYVPIDPEYPEERIRYMLEDTGSFITVSSKESRLKLPSTENTNVIEIDGDWLNISKHSAGNLQTIIKPDHLAYVIYTSGSTGKPKGVMIEHYNVVRLFKTDTPLFDFNEKDVWTMFHSFCFDFSVWEMYGALFYGGRLVIVPKDVTKDASLFLELLLSEKVTVLNQTPSAFYVLQDIAVEKVKSVPVRYVIFGGEALNPAKLKPWKQSYPDCKLINMYGITETTVHVTYQEIEWQHIQSGNSIIGKPIPTLSSYVLDKNKNLVPVGITGEMYVGGAGLARGYLNSAELTGEKFLNDPFSERSGGRLYRTGDLGRWLHDGKMEYLGRIDEQVKIRGFRIELGEIENVLLQSKLVDQVAVLAKEDKQGNKRLVGYAVAELFDKKAIASYLKSRLPDYMVPSLWMELDSFPLTSNGKIDRKALPDPDASELISNEYEAPQNELERALVGILQELLDVETVGINDNFFELGGHSLLALLFFDSIEKLTGRKLALSTLFNSPTIKELAKIIKDKGWTPPWKSLIPIKPGGSRLPFFCVPPAGGTALHFQQLLKYISPDQPVYVLESIGMDGKDKPHTDLKEMAAFYVKEILSLQPKGPYLLGGRCFGGRVVFEMAQQLRQAGHKVALLAIFDTWPPFTAPPPAYIPQKRDAKHFISRSFHHMRKGRILQVAKNYSALVFYKTLNGIKEKIEYILSDKQKRIYEEVKNIHFRAQDRYVAVKYPGKITLIECGAYKTESREKWKSLAGEGFETYLIPGTDHKTIMTEPHVRLFAEKLNFVLKKTNNEIENKFQTNGEANNTFKEEGIETVV